MQLILALLTIEGVASAVSPISQAVTIGLTNDTLSEVLSGLQEGDQVVARTIAPTTATAATAPSHFGAAAGNRGGAGGAVRIPAAGRSN